jgi:hypothetical protein
MTIVPEGSVAAVAWFGGPGLAGQPVRFVESGVAHVDSGEVARGLSRFVNQVLDRLVEAGIATTLAKEWSAVTEAGEEEAAFSRAAARLGLDPFGVSDAVAEDLIAISEELEPGLLDEFLDSADPSNLRLAAQWLRFARDQLAETDDAGDSIDLLRSHTGVPLGARPYERGYEVAQWVRNQIGLRPVDRIDMTSLVASAVLPRPSAGLEGYAAVSERDAVRLVLPETGMGQNSIRFAQARALGLALTSHRREYLLDPARTDLMKQARAFAAELLAPAEGIAEYLSGLPATTDEAFEAIASRFEASSLLVRRQYQNQVADSEEVGL